MIICFEFYIVLTKGLSDLVLPFIYRDYIKYLLYFYTILLKTTKTDTLTRPAASRSPPLAPIRIKLSSQSVQDVS